MLYLYSINRCTACSLEVCFFVSVKLGVYRLTETHYFKASRKLSLVVTFVPNESIYFFFLEKLAIFVTLMKITHLDFQRNLKRKYRKCC